MAFSRLCRSITRRCKLSDRSCPTCVIAEMASGSSKSSVRRRERAKQALQPSSEAVRLTREHRGGHQAHVVGDAEMIRVAPATWPPFQPCAPRLLAVEFQIVDAAGDAFAFQRSGRLLWMPAWANAIWTARRHISPGHSPPAPHSGSPQAAVLSPIAARSSTSSGPPFPQAPVQPDCI